MDEAPAGKQSLFVPGATHRLLPREDAKHMTLGSDDEWDYRGRQGGKEGRGPSGDLQFQTERRSLTQADVLKHRL